MKQLIQHSVSAGLKLGQHYRNGYLIGTKVESIIESINNNENDDYTVEDHTGIGDKGRKRRQFIKVIADKLWEEYRSPEIELRNGKWTLSRKLPRSSADLSELVLGGVREVVFSKAMELAIGLAVDGGMRTRDLACDSATL